MAEMLVNDNGGALVLQKGLIIRKIEPRRLYRSLYKTTIYLHPSC